MFCQNYLVVKAPKLVKFYGIINHHYRWGYIPVDTRPKRPYFDRTQRFTVEQSVLTASDRLSEQLRPLGPATGSLSTASARRSGEL